MNKENMEKEDSHLNPLAPGIIYRKSDDQFATIKPFSPPQHKKSSKCLVYVLLILVLQSFALLIFGLVVLRIKNPRARISLVVIENLRYESLSSLASLNMTMVTEIRVHNQNFGRFKFQEGNAALMYGNATIGMASISGGQIGRRERRGMSVTFGVTRAENVLSPGNHYVNFSRDINSGLVKFRSFATLRGEVRVVKIVNRHRTAVMNCSMALNLTSRAVQDLLCQ